MFYQSCAAKNCEKRRLNPLLRPDPRKNCQSCDFAFLHEFGHFPNIPKATPRIEVPTTYCSG